MLAQEASWPALATQATPDYCATRPLLRAQFIAGAALGAGQDDPLLADPASIGIRVLRSVVLTIYDELDIIQTAADLRDRPSRDERWLAERGVRLERLEDSRRPSRLVGVYDPEEIWRAFRAALEEDWASGSVGLEPCACPLPHLPRHPDALPAWPPRPVRAPQRSRPSLAGSLASPSSLARVRAGLVRVAMFCESARLRPVSTAPTLLGRQGRSSAAAVVRADNRVWPSCPKRTSNGQAPMTRSGLPSQ